MRDQSPDSRLRAEVLNALRDEPMLDEGRLDVEIHDGVATVVGTVSSMAEKLTAEAVVDSVDGVSDVLSRIDVKRPGTAQPHDDDLTRIVESVLEWDALVPEQDISVGVVDGWLTLRGSVPIASQSVEAERAVRHLAGLRGVTNELELETPPVTPEEIRSVILDALERHARHRSRRVDVIVDGRTVVLRGTTESASQKRAIHEAVAHAAGVDTVLDELLPEIRSGSTQ